MDMNMRRPRVGHGVGMAWAWRGHGVSGPAYQVSAVMKLMTSAAVYECVKVIGWLGSSALPVVEW